MRRSLVSSAFSLLLAALALALLALAAVPAAAQPAHLVADINPTDLWGIGLAPSQITVIGDRIYFSGDSERDGRELWVSDGTVFGNRLVRDIVPGRASSNPEELTAVGATLFFYVTLDAEPGEASVTELWKSDGTVAGTRLVKRLVPDGSGASPIQALASYNGTLYFLAADGITPGGRALWKSDGTEGGTVAVVAVQREARSLISAGNWLYFAAADLWQSDGTAPGTRMVRAGTAPAQLFPVGNRLFFFSTNDKLWTTDGTTPGTVELASGLTLRGRPTVAGDQLFFVNDEPLPVLYRANATGLARLVPLLHDLEPYCVGAMGDGTGARLFFATSQATPTSVTTDLWTSDGTVPGTARFASIPYAVGEYFGTAGARAWFRVYHSRQTSLDSQLWSADGTPGSPAPFQPLKSSTVPLAERRGMTGPQGALFVNLAQELGGEELWRIDGTLAGTYQVTHYLTRSSLPEAGVGTGGRLFFSARVPDTGREPWTSNGTPEGTVLVKDLEPGPAGSDPALFKGLGETAVFTANVRDDLPPRPGLAKTKLWRSDGTASGTFRVNDGLLVADPTTFSLPRPRVVKAGALVFFENLFGTSSTPNGPVNLWRTDGTTDGTLPQFAPGPGFVVGDLAAVGREAFYTVHPAGGLWKSDGELNSGSQVKALRGNTDPSPQRLHGFTEAGGFVFFMVTSPTEGTDLWKSDGTSQGTVRVAHLGSQSDPGDVRIPRELTGVGRMLFFQTLATARGVELWRSDGTEAGTGVVKDIRPGPPSSSPRSLATVGRRLLFSADDGVHGQELWRSDGTPEGTVLVKDIFPGVYGSSIARMTTVGNVAFFAADDGTHGYELWRSDGTPEGTQLVQDIGPGINPSNPRPLGLVGDQLYFAADDEVHGDELWALPLSPAVSIDDREVVSGSAANASFRLVLSAPASVPVTIDYTTADGTAVAGTDYVATSGSVTFTPGRTFHSIHVPILPPPETQQVDRSFTVHLTGVQGAFLVDDQATGLIRRPAAGPGLAPVYRAYNPTADYHFFTASLAELSFVVAHGYQNESTPIPLWLQSTHVPGTSAVFRLYNPYSGRHYYTANPVERDVLTDLGYVYELDLAFIYDAPQPDTLEVFRMYNRRSGTHLYTTSVPERDFLLANFPGIWEQHSSLGWSVRVP